ncbi:2-isopropylmalate synthase [Streptomyces sp. CO7]
MSSITALRTPAGPVPADAPSWNRQRGSLMPSHRYRDVHARVDVPLSGRDWPGRRLTRAPLWVPVDLRDGNQALPEPMDPARKRRFFELMVAMGRLWDATPQRPVILNLPATVEVATPNVYADQIEHMHKNLARRESVILSVHPHNDRGTGVACAELALLAGAQRVEGCVFGNGERTGNVDLATLALNLHAQGVDPMIDFSDIDEIRRTVEYCTQLELHPRHPYVGDLVHTAFSGTHQDAIRKGLAEHRARAAAQGLSADRAEWRVPYLPIDPADIGRSYEAVIRVNSQSGKGGIAHLLETAHGIELPRRLLIDLARHVQHHTDAEGAEVSAHQVWQIFQETYLHDGPAAVTLTGCESREAGERAATVRLSLHGQEFTTTHQDVGPVEALVHALDGHGLGVEILGLHQTSVRSGSDSDALTLVEYRTAEGTGWAAGVDRSVLTATLDAVVRAANAVANAAARKEADTAATAAVHRAADTAATAAVHRAADTAATAAVHRAADTVADASATGAPVGHEGAQELEGARR